jgi:type III secretion protein U
MADSGGTGEKTEQASPKRLRDAHEKGQVAKSAELAGALSFLATILCVMSMLGFSAHKVAGLSLAVDRSFEMLDKTTLAAMTLESLYLMGTLSLLPVAVAAFVYTASLWLQVGAVFSLDPVKPKLEKLNPAKGLKQLFSLKSLVNFLLMLLKTAVVGTAVVLVCRQILPDAIRVIHADVGAALAVARMALLHLLMWCGGAFVLLGAADYGYQRWQFLKDNRMSIQDLRRESKEDEGDPHLKAERKRVANESGAMEPMRYMHLASLVVKDHDERLVVFIYRPKQFKAPLYLLRAAGGAASADVMAAARKNGVRVVTDAALTGQMFPTCTTGAMVADGHAEALLAYLGAKAG